MIWWVFDALADCEAAELAARAFLGPDTTGSGQIAPVQITDRWADPAQLLDGRWAIPAQPRMTTPTTAQAREIAPEEFPQAPDI